MTILPRDQVALNFQVINLAEELKTKPESFYSTLTDEQRSLCKKIIDYVAPGLKSELNPTDIPKIKSLVQIASQFNQNRTTAKTSNSWWNLTSWTRSETNQLYKDIFEDANFAQNLKEFEILTKILNNKINPPKNETIDMRLMAELPFEIREIILSLTDFETMQVFKMLTKEDGGKLGSIFKGMDDSERVWCNFAKNLGIKDVFLGNAQVTLMHLKYNLPAIPISNGNKLKDNRRYFTDPRFSRIFNTRKLSDLCKSPMYTRDLSLILAWREMQVKKLCMGALGFENILSNHTVVEDILNASETLEECLSNDYERLNQLKELSFSGIKTPFLPEFLKICIGLEKFDLSDTHIQELPEWLFNITSLNELHLSNSNLAAIPQLITHLCQLGSLSIDGNYFESLDFLAQLPKLKRLKYSGDLFNLASSKTIKKLKKQKVLFTNVDYINQIQGFYRELKYRRKSMMPNDTTSEDAFIRNLMEPLDIDQLKFLKDYFEARDLMYVCLMLARSISSSIDFIDKLEKHLYWNGMKNLGAMQILIEFAKKLPSWIDENKDRFEQIESINLNSEQSLIKLFSIPDIFFEIDFRSLKEINFSNNAIFNLSHKIEKFQNLIYIDFSGNNLGVLPESFENLKNLKFLKIASNKLVKLPLSLRKLDLEVFYFDDNRCMGFQPLITDLRKSVADYKSPPLLQTLQQAKASLNNRQDNSSCVIL